MWRATQRMPLGSDDIDIEVRDVGRTTEPGGKAPGSGAGSLVCIDVQFSRTGRRSYLVLPTFARKPRQMRSVLRWT